MVYWDGSSVVLPVTIDAVGERVIVRCCAA